MTEHRLILSSSSRLDPDNTSNTNFTCILPYEIEVNENYRVGIDRIFIQNFERFTVPEEDKEYFLKVMMHNQEATTGQIRTGIYSSEDILADIAKLLRGYNVTCRINRAGRIKFVIQADDTELILRQKLARLLGFKCEDETLTITSNFSSSSQKALESSLNDRSLVVISDLAPIRMYKNFHNRILKICLTPSISSLRHGQCVVESSKFELLHIAKNNFSSVSFTLCDFDLKPLNLSPLSEVLIELVVLS